jgi:hypothetical protein
VIGIALFVSAITEVVQASAACFAAVGTVGTLTFALLAQRRAGDEVRRQQARQVTLSREGSSVRVINSSHRPIFGVVARYLSDDQDVRTEPIHMIAGSSEDFISVPDRLPEDVRRKADLWFVDFNKRGWILDHEGDLRETPPGRLGRRYRHRFR